ncbi:hypothetical protein GCM10023331_21790 [Algivirga pacifica]|uniref:Uncharacterized protein n=1 Tax=Algivirga pacifica TaxID=1162670 RepID=A0ABP9DEH9_9BACT
MDSLLNKYQIQSREENNILIEKWINNYQFLIKINGKLIKVSIEKDVIKDELLN